ncbi:MAG: polysaccharide biosynthesis/export family protein [Dysgonomonas sp.]|nr:polysaccharide biosynthesis/export family protein [Dysgonomonas sp.]
MKNKLLVFCLLVVSLLSSCVTSKDTNLLQEDIRKNYLPDFNQNNDYKIIPGDRLTLQLYTLDEEMQKLFAMYTRRDYAYNNNNSSAITNQTDPNRLNILNVYSDGTVNIPYLSKIPVENLSLLEAKNLIESKFQEFSPNITIELRLENRFFSLLGETSESRVAMPAPKITIYQALALASPLQPFGNYKKVSIIRQTPDGTEVKTFDLRSKDIVNSEFYYIQPNDVIYIGQMSRTFFGRITSFTGILSILGILGTITGVVALLINR